MQRIKKTIKKVIKKTLNLELSGPKSNTQKSDIQFVNEAVNIDKKVIFIAIPKTGSTTIRNQLIQEGTPLIGNPHLNIVQIRDLIYIYLLKQNLGENRNFPHTDRLNDAELRKKSNEIFESFFKFSAVRNPWSRAVSLYFRREGIQLRDKMTFEEFCENHLYASDTCRQPTLHRNQYDWISDQNGEILIDYVYKLEDIENAISDISNMTNGRLQLKNMNRNQNPISNDYKNLYNDKTRKLIEKRFEKDIDYFKYTF